jgi:uncharacterized OB-fold protein
MRGMKPEGGESPAGGYRRHLASGVLGFQRCAGCKAAIFYPRVICPFCGRPDPAWETSSGHGVVYATTAVYRREGDPYNGFLVDLEEGFRIMSRVEGAPAEDVEGEGSRISPGGELAVNTSGAVSRTTTLACTDCS